jgi:hypothetical protein
MGNNTATRAGNAKDILEDAVAIGYLSMQLQLDIYQSFSIFKKHQSNLTITQHQ